ncbi:DUF433 domain-containing protein [Salinarimonas ramus]|uniref:DUF433 domain-containing protein n=1 Tax=Salinarimonas ramus TaxID=690164 RepID=A0A917V5V9_9HYPH|nr:DUF433 domain-containing protein [Salinarimonas ramus]GGK41174.1 hypothetical protein GCM10011322_30390 [Salinarimonas ramus]
MERLEVPAYQVREAARYARTSTDTVVRWQVPPSGGTSAIASRDARTALSYLQLIEIGVVAAMRQAGVPLGAIRAARGYMEREFQARFPFAEHRFAAYGAKLFIDYDRELGGLAKERLITVTDDGQLAWRGILAGRLREFDYDPEIGAVLSWRLDGVDSPIRLDPRRAFGAPNVRGVATWVLRDRWKSGEAPAEIADDFDLDVSEVEAALHFEGVETSRGRPERWTS